MIEPTPGGVVLCHVCLVTDRDLIGKRFAYRHQLVGEDPCRAALLAGQTTVRRHVWQRRPTEGGLVLCDECEITDLDLVGNRWAVRHLNYYKTAPCLPAVEARARYNRRRTGSTNTGPIESRRYPPSEPCAVPSCPNTRMAMSDYCEGHKGRGHKGPRLAEVVVLHEIRHDTLTLGQYRELRA